MVENPISSVNILSPSVSRTLRSLLQYPGARYFASPRSPPMSSRRLPKCGPARAFPRPVASAPRRTPAGARHGDQPSGPGQSRMIWRRLLRIIFQEGSHTHRVRHSPSDRPLQVQASELPHQQHPAIPSRPQARSSQPLVEGEPKAARQFAPPEPTSFAAVLWTVSFLWPQHYFKLPR